MAGRINDDDIRTLKDRIDIAAVISPYTSLKSSGSQMMGRCPFHDEKSPSFSVSPHKKAYYCFGCGVHGDAIGFVMEIEGMTFTDAVEKLARQFGVELRYQELKPGQRKALGRRTRVLELLEEAASFYRDQLRGPGGAQARTYLQERKVPEGQWEVFGLGWAPDEWDALSTHLKVKGASTKELVDAGLATQGRHGAIDRFRARVLFPIHDQRGSDVVAFGGRILPGGPEVTRIEGKAPKYINSPATEVYDKSTTLYGLHLARREIVKTQEVLVVEGYMDVIALHIAGVRHAVAPCGTALTEQHFQMIERMDARVTLSLDADAAGFEAAERARERASQAGVTDLGVLVLPEGKDPADIVSEGGATALAEVLAGRKTAVEFQIEHILRNADLSTPERQTAAYRSTFDLLGRIDDPTLRYKYVFDVVAPAVGLPAQRIEDELNRTHPVGVRDRSTATVTARPMTLPGSRDPQMQLERQVLQIALQRPDLMPEGWQLTDDSVFTSEPARQLFRAICAAGDDFDAILDAMPDDDMRRRVRGLAVAELTLDLEAGAVQGLLDALRGRDAQRRYEAVRRRLADGRERLDATERTDLMAEMRDLQALLRTWQGRGGA